MTVEQNQLLQQLAGKYIWWKTADESMAHPGRIAAQVMNVGEYEDVQRLASAVGDEFLREILRHAEIGEFSDRSWHYWHYRLGLAEVGRVPAQPARDLG